MSNANRTRQEYDRQQAIRSWNARFRVPEVCTAYWTAKDWQAWRDAREPLPPFEVWQKEGES